METTLYHLAPWDGFRLCDYTPASLASEGFVHLSSAGQLLKTANRWFEGVEDLVVLVLDVARLGSPLRWEDLYQRGEEFPHLYGALPGASVKAMVRLSRGDDGMYQACAELNAIWSTLGEPLENVEALIEPSRRFPEVRLPELCVLCFFEDVVNDLAGVWLEGLGSQIGAKRVCLLETQGQKVAVCFPGVGGPVAGATLEELIALGCRRFVGCGGAGSLRSEQSMGQLVVVERALRNEGLSHHYLPPQEWVHADESLLEQTRQVLKRGNVPFLVGATWTTDALYRETPKRIEQRRAQGCLTVEMEAASLLAVASYRQVALQMILYCGDDLGGQEWDFRDWTSAQSVQENLFRLALEVVRS